MKNKKLFRLLGLLTGKELSRFHDFVASPYFNKDKKVLLLMDMIAQYAPTFSAEKLFEYKTYEGIYTKPTSIEALFRKTVKLFKRYLEQEAFEQNQYYRKHLLMKELLRINAMDEFESEHKRAVESIKGKEQNDGDWFYIKALYDLNFIEYLSIGFGKQSLHTEYFASMGENFRLFFISKMLHVQTWINNLTWMTPDFMKTKVNFGALVKDWNVDNNLGLKRLQLALALTEEEDESMFFSLKDQYFEQSNMEYRERLLILASLNNYRSKQVSSRKEEFSNYIYQAELRFLESNSIGDKNYIYPGMLVNIVINTRFLYGTEAAREILAKVDGLIAPAYKAEILHFLNGDIYMYEKKYELAAREFLMVPSKSLLSVLGQFKLLIVYFEVEETVLIPHAISSFRKRVRESKRLSDGKKQMYLNFIMLYKMLFSIKFDPNYKKTTAAIEEKYKEFPMIVGERFFKKHLADLKRGK